MEHEESPVRHHRGRGARGALLASAGALVGLLATPISAQAAPKPPTYYVSLGDSYAAGYQPGLGATPGFTTYVAQRTNLTLANFGCNGATTTSLLTSVGCPLRLPHTAGAALYPTTTQAAAAEAFLSAHRGHIGLITVSIGGNDVTSCAANSNPISCVASAVTTVSKNVSTLAAGLRAAAGPRVPLIGLTYPDVILGAYVYPTQPPSASRVSLAKLSVVAFRSLINPALTKAYGSAGGVLVDTTAATGAYTSLSRTVRLRPYGTIPVPVASVCTLTWFCARGNIHPTTRGYTLIGKLVVAKLAAMRRA
jgi:lysophospholipase L1-like esterase